MNGIDINEIHVDNCVDASSGVITMPYMSKKKNMQTAPPKPRVQKPKRQEQPTLPPEQSATSNREGVGKMFYLEDDLEIALKQYMDSMKPLKPTQTAVFSEGLRMFLASKGFWPPKKE